MPGIIGVDVEGFDQVNRLACQQQIGRAAVLVVAGAGAIGIIEIEMSAEPIGGIIGIAQGIGIFIEERLIPGEAIVPENEYADQRAKD